MSQNDNNRIPGLNPETLFSPSPLNRVREAAGYLPTQVTLRVQGDIKLAELQHAIAGLFEIYTDYTEALCLRTVAAGNAHRAQVQAEKQARAEHAKRHADLVRQEGARNVANNYRSPWVACGRSRSCLLHNQHEGDCDDGRGVTEYRSIDCGSFDPPELRALPAETDDEGLPL